MIFAALLRQRVNCPQYRTGQIISFTGVKYNMISLMKEGITMYSLMSAEVAQLVEQLIRNEQVVGSSPIFGSNLQR